MTHSVLQLLFTSRIPVVISPGSSGDPITKTAMDFDCKTPAIEFLAKIYSRGPGALNELFSPALHGAIQGGNSQCFKYIKDMLKVTWSAGVYSAHYSGDWQSKKRMAIVVDPTHSELEEALVTDYSLVPLAYSEFSEPLYTVSRYKSTILMGNKIVTPSREVTDIISALVELQGTHGALI